MLQAAGVELGVRPLGAHVVQIIARRARVGIAKGRIGGKDQALPPIAGGSGVGEVLRHQFVIGRRHIECGGGAVHTANHTEALPWAGHPCPSHSPLCTWHTEQAARSAQATLSVAKRADAAKARFRKHCAELAGPRNSFAPRWAFLSRLPASLPWQGAYCPSHGERALNGKPNRSGDRRYLDGHAADAVGRDHRGQAAGRRRLGGERHGQRGRGRGGDGADRAVAEDNRVIGGGRIEAEAVDA